jgi:hypothetical protein
MASLQEAVYNADYPLPVDNETLDSYAKRMALIGAHVGIGWSMAHNTPSAVAYVAPPEVEQAVADALDLGTTGA